jgi:hypothetical protein
MEATSMNGETQNNFDWVKARADCSLGQVFKDLKRGVKRDVEAANKISADQPHSFAVSSEDGCFSVTRSSSVELPLSVEFRLKHDGIEASGDLATDFTIGLTLNNDGHCMLKVNGAELEQWHVRRMALEDLFFGKGGRPMPRAQ